MIRGAVLLARVSTLKLTQEESPERQLEMGREWAERQGIPVVKEITERVSGARRLGDRPGLDEALQIIRRREASALWVHRVDRLGRDPITVLQVMEQSRDGGWQLYVQDMSGSRPFDSRDPGAVFMLTAMAAAAGLTRALQGQAAIEGKERARQKHGDAFVTRPKEELPDEQGRWLRQWLRDHPAANWHQATKAMKREGLKQPGRWVKRTNEFRPARPWAQSSLQRAYGRWVERTESQ